MRWQNTFFPTIRWLLLISLFILVACAPTSEPQIVATPTPPPAARLALDGLIDASATPAPAPTRTATATPAPSATAPALPIATPTLLPSPTPEPTPDPLEPFVAAMRPAFVGDIAANADLPRYTLDLWIYPAERVLTGTVRIDLTNTTDAALSDVALRLYPNFPRDLFDKGGNVGMDITSAAVAGQMVTASYAAQNTAVLLPLPQPLEPGGQVTLDVGFTATIEPWSDGTWPLPSYYPILAVREGTDWRLDVTQFPDRVFSESALYAANVTVPPGVSVVASGSTADVRTQNDGSTTHTIVTGPMRQFALTVGDFAVAQAAAGEVAVNVYQARGNGYDSQFIAQAAADALAVFERRFGPYPYRELDLHLLPYGFDGGDEYPGLIFVYTDGIDAGARYVTAHEVAHQWWFGMVGNDIFREPWLDEALAQYSGIIYAEEVLGAAAAQADWEREVLARYQGAVADGDLPVGWAITDYPNFNVYYRTVYGKGAVFLATLRKTLGDAVFFQALQSYAITQRYGVGTTAELQQAFEQASGQDLDGLFAAWVGR